MSTRTLFARCGAIVLCSLIVFPALAAAKTTTAKLRVLTPTTVLDPGTTYIVDDSVTVPTRPDADCLGPPGGSGAEYSYDEPTALSLLATAGRTTKSVSPLSLSDQFGFGIVVCGIGGAEAGPSEFWYLKSNHSEASVGADQLKVGNGDEVLFYLAADNFPAPNPAELELSAPARAKPGEPVPVSVVQHACVTDQTTFEVTCGSTPAAGVTVGGGGAIATTGADGKAELILGGSAELTASREGDIPSQALQVCVSASLEECPARRGERIVGSPEADKIKGTKGADAIRARGGADKVDLRAGGKDSLNCGRGKDTALVPRSSQAKIARNCERIRRR